MRFEDPTIRGIDREAARPLPERPGQCEVPVLLSSAPPAPWKATLREVLAGHELIGSETRVREDVLLLRASVDGVAEAFRALEEALRCANARFRREHREVLEAQERLDRALTAIDAPRPLPGTRAEESRRRPLAPSSRLG